MLKIAVLFELLRFKLYIPVEVTNSTQLRSHLLVPCNFPPVRIISIIYPCYVPFKGYLQPPHDQGQADRRNRSQGHILRLLAVFFLMPVQQSRCSGHGWHACTPESHPARCARPANIGFRANMEHRPLMHFCWRRSDDTAQPPDTWNPGSHPHHTRLKTFA